MDKKNPMILVAILSVTAAVGLFLWVVQESRALSYLSSDPKVCINCHTMNTSYATWQHSSHRGKASCVDCHLPRDSFINKMIAKARDGYKHATAMTLRSYGNVLRVSDDAAARIQANCISCHQAAVSQMLDNSALYDRADPTVAMGRRCWDCHRRVPHGTTRSLTATPDNLGVKEL